jgi:hypothetical protein
MKTMMHDETTEHTRNGEKSKAKWPLGPSVTVHEENAILSAAKDLARECAVPQLVTAARRS